MFWESVKMLNWAEICQEEARKQMKHICVEHVGIQTNNHIGLVITDRYVHHKSYLDMRYNIVTKMVTCTHTDVSVYDDMYDKTESSYELEIHRMIHACRTRIEHELHTHPATRLFMVTEHIVVKKP